MPLEQCEAMARLIEADLGVQPTVAVVAVRRVPEISGQACRVTWTGSGLQQEDQIQIVDRFFANFLDWQPDFLISMDGPALEVQGFRKDRQLMVMSARWDAPDGMCKSEEIVGTCTVPPERRIWTLEIDGMTTQP
jgi:hypothetical protein